MQPHLNFLDSTPLGSLQVLHGVLQVRTRHPTAFDSRIPVAAEQHVGGAGCHGDAGCGKVDFLEEEMRALFDSIDMDGSGGAGWVQVGLKQVGLG